MQPDHPIARPRIDPAVIPFRQTAAFRRYGTVVDPDVDAPEDLYLKAIIEEQGFDGRPHVLPSRLVDRFVATGEVELFRGVAAPAHADAFRVGRFFVGRGVYGGGASAATGPHALVIAREYAAGGLVLRLTVKTDARIVDFDELELSARRRLAEALEALRRVDDRSPAALTAREALHAEYDDIGRLAAYLGYDVIHAADPDFHVVLNRTAVRVQREDLR